MRVVHVYRTYFPDPPGGLQEAIRQICLATKAEGVESQIFTLSPQPVPSVLESAEGSIIRCRSWGAPASCDIGGPDAFLRFRSLARRADVIHYHFPWPFADMLRLCAGGKKPSVMTYHSDIVRQRLLGQVYAPLMQSTLRSMDAVVATSPAYAATSPVLKQVVTPERLRIIPLGMVDENAAIIDDPSIVTRLNPSKEPYFLALGVLRYYKGLHTLIQAAASVNARIIIAGSGPEESALRAQAANLNASNILFAGRVSVEEKYALLRHCRALVLPSHLRSEAFGMVLTEASLCSRPMICCEVGSGTSFVNEHEVTGLVVQPESPHALAHAMNRLLADETLATQMGHAARKRYERLFSGAALGKAYSDLYREAARPSARI